MFEWTGIQNVAGVLRCSILLQFRDFVIQHTTGGTTMVIAQLMETFKSYKCHLLRLLRERPSCSSCGFSHVHLRLVFQSLLCLVDAECSVHCAVLDSRESHA